MAADLYNLIFFPKVREGKDKNEVQKALAETLKVDESKVKAWLASDKPTVILKEVTDETADRYMRAILTCGASCNIQPAQEEGDGLSLVPKTFKTSDLFICPQCEHEVDVPITEKLEQCPKCGLVMSKWEERMKIEKEKEQIRRRLLRESRMRDDQGEEYKRKMAELDRLKALELEIMKELGIKPPGRLWTTFERYPFPIASAATILVIGLTVVVLQYVNKYLADQDYKTLVSTPPTAQMDAIAPTLSTAVRNVQNGNDIAIGEITNTVDLLQGRKAEVQKIMSAAGKMMKGAGAQQFMNMASEAPALATSTMTGPDGEASVPVNTSTLGGVTGVPGSSSFSSSELNMISAPVLADGRDEVLDVMSMKRVETDPNDPEAPPRIVDELDRMDGSMVVDMMKRLKKDFEWDQFLLLQANAYLDSGELETASDVITLIDNSILRLQGLGDIMVFLHENDDASDVKVYMARARIVLDKITDFDAKAKAVINLGRRLAAAGDPLEPDSSISRLQEMISDSDDLFEQAFLHSRLAVFKLESGNQLGARKSFTSAVNAAGTIGSRPARIGAFVRISQRYYDARNLTLAQEILSESEVMAATQLHRAERSQVFAQIAIGRAYMGDIPGAFLAIENAGVDRGRQQVLGKVAESLIDAGKLYQAQAVLDRSTDAVEFNRLQIRLITELIYSGRGPEASNRLPLSIARTREVMDLGQRATLLSQYARLMSRVENYDDALKMFREAIDISNGIEGRVREVNLGVISLDMARSSFVEQGRELVYEIEESVIRDPIDVEVNASVRTLGKFARDGLIDDQS